MTDANPHGEALDSEYVRPICGTRCSPATPTTMTAPTPEDARASETQTVEKSTYSGQDGESEAQTPRVSTSSLSPEVGSSLEGPLTTPSYMSTACSASTGTPNPKCVQALSSLSSQLHTLGVSLAEEKCVELALPPASQDDQGKTRENEAYSSSFSSEEQVAELVLPEAGRDNTEVPAPQIPTHSSSSCTERLQTESTSRRNKRPSACLEESAAYDESLIKAEEGLRSLGEDKSRCMLRSSAACEKKTQSGQMLQSLATTRLENGGGKRLRPSSADLMSPSETHTVNALPLLSRDSAHTQECHLDLSRRTFEDINVQHANSSQESDGDLNRTTLWIGDLEKWEDEEVVFHFFSRLAPSGVVSVKIARDREEQRSLGYGFIDFASREIAERILTSAPAIKRPHGRRFKLTWAKGKTRRPFNPMSSNNTGGVSSTHDGTISLRSSHVPSGATSSGLNVAASRVEWYIKLTECTACSDAQRLCDEVLRATGFAPGVTHLSTHTVGTQSEATIYFRSSEWFFSFLQYFSDGKVNMGAFSGYIEIPPAVMSQWTHLYERANRQIV